MARTPQHTLSNNRIQFLIVNVLNPVFKYYIDLQTQKRIALIETIARMYNEDLKNRVEKSPLFNEIPLLQHGVHNSYQETGSTPQIKTLQVFLANTCSAMGYGRTRTLKYPSTWQHNLDLPTNSFYNAHRLRNISFNHNQDIMRLIQAHNEEVDAQIKDLEVLLATFKQAVAQTNTVNQFKSIFPVFYNQLPENKKDELCT